MARITARQAFTRSRARRENQRTEKARVITEARQKYIRQLTDLGLMATQNRQPPSGSVDDDDSSITGSQKSDQTKPPRKLLTPGRKIRLRRGAENNKKITDYYTVQSRGRENLPKSPQQIVRINTVSTSGPMTRTRTCSTPRYSGGGNNHIEAEIITLNDSDSEDDSNNNLVSSITCHSSVKSEQSVESDQSLVPITSPFKDLNVSVKVDEDIEIVDMLPPIPLREHPVFELEEL